MEKYFGKGFRRRRKFPFFWCLGFRDKRLTFLQNKKGEVWGDS